MVDDEALQLQFQSQALGKTVLGVVGGFLLINVVAAFFWLYVVEIFRFEAGLGLIGGLLVIVLTPLANLWVVYLGVSSLIEKYLDSVVVVPVTPDET